MKMQGIEHGVMFYAEDGTAPVYVEVLAHDARVGARLLVATKHGAAEVRVTPKGTSVEAKSSRLGGMVEAPYYEVTVRLPLWLYQERWFYAVADAAGANAAVSGHIVPRREPS